MAGFLEDSKGNKSSIRLLLFIIVGYALVIGTFVLFREGSVAALAFISGIIALGGTFKIIQNNQEKEKKDGQESA